MLRRVALLFLWALLSSRVGAEEPAADDRAARMAAVIGIAPEIYRVLHAPPPTSVETSLAHLEAVQRTVVVLSRASLDVDAMSALVQHEEVEARSAKDVLVQGHEESVARWNIAAVIVGNGTSLIGSSMQFGRQEVTLAGDGLIAAGAVLATAFSIVALVKSGRGPMPATITTQLLAPLLDCPPRKGSRYPDWIWRYLNTPLPGAAESIRGQLLAKWTHERRFSHKGAPQEMRLLCAPLRAATRVDAGALDDRMDMLADVRERLAGLSVEIDRLWQLVGEPRAPL